MTLLSEIRESAIVENLKKRFLDDWIFTYIGPVLVSINPFKQMKYFTDREVGMYQGAAQYENPPHIYALADNMYRNMTIDSENQCVIISGESGAGKTVAAKYIMNYLSLVSGSGPKAQQVKDVILQSNPLLEAFGNAKTVRNNNSSRFGKYVEIIFRSGQPVGGKVSNFLLEKSRVVMQNPHERNFHIFYQLCFGMDSEAKNQFGITDVDYYNYLNAHSCYKVDETNDAADYEETLSAMATMRMSLDEQSEVLQLASGILHLGNVLFIENNNDVAVVHIDERLDYPSYLLQVDQEALRKKLTSRVMESKWGANTERVDVTANVQQAEATRDALAKGLYARLFDYLVKRVNEAMDYTHNTDLLSLGILDIYGFEIFQKNGFEQFCINFVNEKLQQIFIELTLKAEQEEYVQEGIAWRPIEYFNNAVVCELIEDRRPKPGVMAILDDVCASQHGVREGADANLKAKLRDNCRQHQYYEDAAMGFLIHHYAGVVEYNVEGFCERNRDIFYDDLIELMQSSASDFIRSLFPENVSDKASKKRPVTAGAKIKAQANVLVQSLMECSPHYIRCIKPNETKRPRDWEHKRVQHQVEYLGLKENIRVRRAGFAYRRPFEKFLHRYALLTRETWPVWQGGDVRQGVTHILRSVNMSQDEYQLGKTKLFIKAPESLFLLEEQREKKFDFYARVLQKAFQRYFNRQKFLRQKEEAADVFYQKKERRQHSLNRNFYADYIGLDNAPGLKNLVGRRDKIQFAQTVTRYDRKFKGVKSAKRDLIVTHKGIFLIGREVAKTGPNKGQALEVVTRHIPLERLFQVSLSPRQDDIVVLHVANSYDSLLQVPFKTELVTVLKRLKEQFEQGKGMLKIVFQNKIEFLSDKSSLGVGKKRTLTFHTGPSNQETITAQGLMKNLLSVFVAPGLANTSRPSRDRRASSQGVKKTPRQEFARQPPRVGPGAPLPALPGGNVSRISQQPVRAAPTRPPGPPSGPAPASQLHHRPSVRIKKRGGQNTVHEVAQPSISQLRKQLEDETFARRRISKEEKQLEDEAARNMNFLRTPDGGQAHAYRKNVAGSPNPAPRTRPVPAGGRPKPQIPKRRPKARAIYSYYAGDQDEICLKEGEIIDLVGEDDSGWWTGKNAAGQEGLFPGSYVEKV